MYNSEIPKNSDILPVNVTSTTNIRTNVVSIVLNKRYSTDNNLVDINKAIENIYKRFYNLSQIEPPFNVKLFNSHVDNARKFRLANKSDQPRIVYIYTNEGLIEGSPFASFSLAHFISKIPKKIPDPYYKLGIYTCKINISMNITSRQ